MAEILIRGNKPESIMPILDSAIHNQLKLLKASINRTQIRISSFEQKYSMSTEQFMQKIREEMDDDNLECNECSKLPFCIGVHFSSRDQSLIGELI